MGFFSGYQLLENSLLPQWKMSIIHPELKSLAKRRNTSNNRYHPAKEGRNGLRHQIKAKPMVKLLLLNYYHLREKSCVGGDVSNGAQIRGNGEQCVLMLFSALWKPQRLG